MPQKIKNQIATLTAVVIWAGLALQLYVFVHRSLLHDQGVMHGVLMFFYFFTNLANLLAAFTITRWLKHGHISDSVYPNQHSIASALVYVWMAGTIFNLKLRQLMPPGTVLHLTNIVLHDVVPLLFLLFWALCIPRTRFGLRDILSWLSFPVAYFIYVLISGHATGHYPYPFLDVAKYGYAVVLVNALQIAAGILALSLSLLALNRFKTKPGVG
jgi:hypothetical protein